MGNILCALHSFAIFFAPFYLGLYKDLTVVVFGTHISLRLLWVNVNMDSPSSQILCAFLFFSL